MAFFDNIFAGQNGVASTLVDLFGVSGVVYTHVVKGEYDPLTDTLAEDDVIVKTVTTTPIAKFTTDEIAKLGVQTSDCKVIGKGIDFEGVSEKTDTVTISGKTYMIVKAFPVYSGDSISAFTLQLREQE